MENNNNSSFLPPEAELLLTIRFSASIPDVLLEIPSPSTTTAAGLKQLIRARLPPELSNHRLRLIYSGRGLEDTVPLSKSLKLPPPPPRSGDGNYLPNGNNIHDEKDKDKDKGKGKVPVRDPPLPRLYVHCSIGDIVLSASDLAAEAAQASTLLIQQQQQQRGSRLSLSQKRAQEEEEAQRRLQQQQEASTTTPAPRGFDRLLSAGFTPAEVAQLRSQFLALQSVSRTPDTMPSGAELRELEDRWMDEGSTAAAMPGTGGGAGGAGGGGGIGGAFADDDGGFGTGSQGALDDMLWGAVMGFFWPVGCAMWLRREEGVWSWRKGLAVFVGVVINAAFGAMRVMN